MAFEMFRLGELPVADGALLQRHTSPPCRRESLLEKPLPHDRIPGVRSRSWTKPYLVNCGHATSDYAWTEVLYDQLSEWGNFEAGVWKEYWRPDFWANALSMGKMNCQEGGRGKCGEPCTCKPLRSMIWNGQDSTCYSSI